jgi:4-hydroxy-tetrahydrodipicolinate reductase
MIRAILNGCNGKMGRVVSEEVTKAPDIEIVAGIDKNAETSPFGYPVFDNIDKADVEADLIIDFSRPESVPDLVPYAVRTKTALMVATTGLGKEHLELLEHASESVPVFHTANMSLGVNLVKDICCRVASVLTDGFDIEITEFHHNQKADAPSGTALMLAKAIKETVSESKEFIYGRTPESGKRQAKEIGIHALRGGTMPGEHSVLFAGPDEIIEIRHLALSRKIFALGALRAARFIVGQRPGMYNMDSILSSNAP